MIDGNIIRKLPVKWAQVEAIMWIGLGLNPV